MTQKSSFIQRLKALEYTMSFRLQFTTLNLGKSSLWADEGSGTLAPDCCRMMHGEWGKYWTLESTVQSFGFRALGLCCITVWDNLLVFFFALLELKRPCSHLLQLIQTCTCCVTKDIKHFSGFWIHSRLSWWWQIRFFSTNLFLDFRYCHYCKNWCNLNS